MESSRELHRALAPNWREDETFRIDHYLGKEVVKNMTYIRFGNELLGATWNRDHIANVQVCTTPISGYMSAELFRSPSRNPSALRVVGDTSMNLE